VWYLSFGCSFSPEIHPSRNNTKKLHIRRPKARRSKTMRMIGWRRGMRKRRERLIREAISTVDIVRLIVVYSQLVIIVVDIESDLAEQRKGHTRDLPTQKPSTIYAFD
jgi:hypothetical protein